MNGYLNFEDLELSRAHSRALLNALITRSERQYLRHCLKIFNVPNRTKIYKDFGRTPYNQFKTDEARVADFKAIDERRAGHLEATLNSTTIQQWLAAHSQWYSANRLASILAFAKVEMAGVPVYLADFHQDPYYVQGS